MIFQYEFMRKAFLVGILLSIIMPVLGVNVVLKRLSMLGEALSHSTLYGVAIGLILGFNPVIGAVISCILSAVLIEALRGRFESYKEISLSIITSVSLGLAGILSGFVKNASSFNGFLFGSIVAISKGEVIFVICVFIAVMLGFILMYKELMYISYNQDEAVISGVNVNLVNYLFSILTAFTVAIASRTVGALIVSSLMIIPVATALKVSKSYFSTIVNSCIFSVISMASGLILSYYFALKPGGAIVLIMTGIFLLVSFFKSFIK